MLDLESAIKHCEEVATENEKSIAYYTIQGDKEWLDECEKDCIECAKEHRQLAEWLRELQAYRKAEKEIEQELVNWNDIDNGKCRGLFLATSIIQHYKNEEVNADADIQS